jgi:hypothetical protein
MATTIRERRNAFLNKYKPGVPKRYLLLVAGFAWTIAGAMLFGRGSIWLIASGDHLLARYAIALAAGLVFFLLLFSKISLKHITRIHAIDIVRPCIFSFFDFKGYIMMGLMITGGILLRTFRVIEPGILFTFYVCMGTPLLLSATRFYYSFARYERFARK